MCSIDFLQRYGVFLSDLNSIDGSSNLSYIDDGSWKNITFDAVGYLEFCNNVALPVFVCVGFMVVRFVPVWFV